MRAGSFAAAVVLIVVLMAALTAGAQTPSAPADEHPTLPAGEGRDVMIRVCSQCHSPDVAADQQLDEGGWKELVDQMAGQGAVATEEEFSAIVHYLTTAFPLPAPAPK